MHNWVKKTIFFLADWLYLPEILLWASKRHATILLYHGVCPADTPDGIFNYRRKFITPEAFEKQVRWLKNHFTILPVPTIIELLKSDKRLPPHTLGITFDDGYENIYKYAFPVLKALRIPTTIFITTDLVEKSEPLWFDKLEYALGHTTLAHLKLTLGRTSQILSLGTYAEKCRTDSFLREYMKKVSTEEQKLLLKSIIDITQKNLKTVFATSPYQGLTWNEIQDMQRENFTFAAHTSSHPILSRMQRDTTEREIIDSHNLLARRLGKELKIFAYPNGQEQDFTPEIISFLKESGFSAAFTTIAGKFKSAGDPFQIPRLTLDGSNDFRFFRLTVSGVRSALDNLRKLFKVRREPAGLFFNKTAKIYLAEYEKNTPEGYSFRERKRLALEMLGAVKNKSILDVGSGPGIFMEELLSKGAIITAVDIAPGMIELLKKRFRNPRLQSKLGDIENLSYKDESFDCVTALGVLEYLDSDRPALKEIARVLKPGGKAIISFPNLLSPWRIWNGFLLKTFRFPWRILQKLLGLEPHTIKHREYTQDSIRALMAEANLHTKEIVGYNFKIMLFPLDRLFPSLGVAIANILKRLERTKIKWLATAYLVRADKKG